MTNLYDYRLFLCLFHSFSVIIQSYLLTHINMIVLGYYIYLTKNLWYVKNNVRRNRQNNAWKVDSGYSLEKRQYCTKCKANEWLGNVMIFDSCHDYISLYSSSTSLRASLYSMASLYASHGAEHNKKEKITPSIHTD